MKQEIRKIYKAEYEDENIEIFDTHGVNLLPSDVIK